MDYSKLDGKDQPFWYAILANREYGKNDLSTKDNIYPLWLGFKYGAKAEKIEFNLSEDDVAEIFDRNLEEYSQACKILDSQLGKLREAGMASK